VAAAEVEDLGLPAEHRRQDLGVAGQAAGVGRGDLLVGAEQPGGAEVLGERVAVDGDDHGGGVTAVSGELGRVEVFEQRDERLASRPVLRDCGLDDGPSIAAA
jgi:hypothetical protein